MAGESPAGRGLRRGATVVELVVALALLGIGLTAVSAATIGGARLGRRAVADREADRFAWAIVDSVLTARTPAPGGVSTHGGRFTWTPAPAGAGVRLTLVFQRPSPGGTVTRRFRAFGMAPPPVLPPP